MDFFSCVDRTPNPRTRESTDTPSSRRNLLFDRSNGRAMVLARKISFRTLCLLSSCTKWSLSMPRSSPSIRLKRRNSAMMGVCDRWTYSQIERPIVSRDILGAFAVRSGIITPNSYRRNDYYGLFTEEGFFRLHETLASALMNELLALNANPKQ